ncbi:O-antigen polymerase [Halobacillus sp. ACCC02827]|uniref:O-antigen polymerase n=1 Tax=Halobacillus sp. ACCC02827 TaxID=3052090 RepID=UPI00256FE021|nr:O-antigen polymerase [Halobacillus sp. ACCC02827]WJE15271.1 O-antigen polymerase [Halobacillus sp. ACCC02827]
MFITSFSLYIICCILVATIIVKRSLQKIYLTPFMYVLVMQLLLPFLFIYPFSYSPNNIEAVGLQWYSRYLSYINEALLVGSLGTLFFLLGFYLFSKRKTKYKGIFMKSVDGLANPIVLYLMGFTIFLFMFFMNDFQLFPNPKGVRNIVSSNGIFGPLYNLVVSSLPLLVGLVILRFQRHKNSLDLFMLIILVYAAFLTGSRTVLFSGVLFYIIAYFSLKQHYLRNYLKLLVAGLLFIGVMIVLSLFRMGDLTAGTNIMDVIGNFLYGNTFSDFRDTAWVLAGIQDELLNGKTYISAIMSFVPSSFLNIREIWSLGVITTTATGLDSTTHPGLRPIIFGESYMNFGFIGMILFSFVYGMIISYLDKLYINKLKSEESTFNKLYFLFLILFLTELSSNLMITAGFFYVYVVMGLFLLGKIIKEIFGGKYSYENNYN